MPETHHGERDHEGQERLAKRPVHVQAGAAGARVLRDQLGVGAGGEQRRDQREHERRPDRAADLAADLADQGVDPAAEDVADDEEQQQRGRDRAAQPAVVPDAFGRWAQRRILRDGYPSSYLCRAAAFGPFTPAVSP